MKRFDSLAGMYYPAGVLGPGDTMVEVGAYDGKRLRESALWTPGVEYHLLEPSPILFPELQATFADAPNAHCHQVAIAQDSGPIAFYMREPRGTGNGLYLIAGADETSVDGLSFADAFDRYGIGDVRLMLVNCEGAEFDIFSGGITSVEWIVVSFHVDKHPTKHEGRQIVAEHLSWLFETVAWFREETRCQVWVGRNRRRPGATPQTGV